MPTPKVAAIHDMSGYGRCSLTVAMPVLSAMGVQCCPLPTAFLSTHTGGFQGYTFLDMTGEMPKIAEHWKKLGLTFDAVYSGFMGSEEQMQIVLDFHRDLCGDRGIFVVDPVMGDHGKRYSTYTEQMCTAMAKMAEKADVITPNLTEASYLLDIPYEELENGSIDLGAVVLQLSSDCSRSVVLTGVSTSPDTIGAACYDRRQKEIRIVQTERIPGEYHGTGDVFTSVLTGALVLGRSLLDATEEAVEFVKDCAQRSYTEQIPPREGVDFEPLLWELADSCREKRIK